MAIITLSYDSKNTSVRKILEGLLNLGLVKEERTIIAESKNEFSEKTLTKESLVRMIQSINRNNCIFFRFL